MGDLNFFEEFLDFLREYKVLAVAIAFIMGQATNDLVKSFVTNIFMPLINPFIPMGDWETSTFTFWKISLNWGIFLSVLINFVILAVLVFVLFKHLPSKGEKLRELAKANALKKAEEKITKK